ncbi:uncharacterized protein [Diadema setosum]|uniref:uncharacterized protein isoform X2 n=1 Tax=Diadema setosum TaxID=31175 RepID=UPI003B3B0E65
MASSPPKKACSKSTAYCSAIHCRNRQCKRPDLSFFRFPRDPESLKWIQNTGRNDLLLKFGDTPLYLSNNCRLCSEHFETSQFSNKKTKNRLNWNAVPTIFKTTNPPKRGNPRWLVKGSSETPQAVLNDTNSQEGQLSNTQTEDQLSNTQTEDQLNRNAVPTICKPSPPESATPPNLLSREAETSQSVVNDTNKQTATVEKDTHSFGHDHLYCLSKQSSKRKPLTRSRTTQTPRGNYCRPQKKERQRTSSIKKKRAKPSEQSTRKKAEKRPKVSDLIKQAGEYLEGTSLSFFASQLKNAARRKRARGRRWTHTDKVVALSLYHQSHRAYEYCQGIFTLPSVPSMRRWLSNIKVVTVYRKKGEQNETKETSTA